MVNDDYFVFVQCLQAHGVDPKAVQQICVVQVVDGFATLFTSEAVNIVASPEEQNKGIDNTQNGVETKVGNLRNYVVHEIFRVVVLYHGPQRFETQRKQGQECHPGNNCKERIQYDQAPGALCFDNHSDLSVCWLWIPRSGLIQRARGRRPIRATLVKLTRVVARLIIQ